MKKAILTLTVLTCCFGGFAQNAKDYEYIIKNVPFIFEGEVIKTTEFYGKDMQWNRDSSGYRSNIIKITKVFRGNDKIKPGTIELVTVGLLEDILNMEDGGLAYSVGMVGIFLCNPIGNVPSLGISTDNDIRLWPYCPYSNNCHIYFEQFYGLMRKFNSRTEIYEFLGKFENITIPEEVEKIAPVNKQEIEEQPAPHVKKKDVFGSSDAIKKQNEIRYAKNVKNYEKYMEQLQIRIDNAANLKQHQNTYTAAALNNLSFSFANPVETGTTPRFFEFDVMVEANNNATYFDNCLLRIEYNPLAFGTNIVANNKVTITKGAAYNDISYIDPDANAIDQTTSVIGVPFSTDFGAGSWNRTLVTTTPTQILHFKIEIQTCSQNTNLSFTDTAFTPMFSFYANNANDDISNTFGYDNTSYLNDVNSIYGLLCVPVITSFTPNPITAGTNSVLTITGTNFGAARGTGQVAFKNGENQGATFIRHLDYIDYFSWADTEIKVIVPSVVDTLPNLNFNKRPTAGSGEFYVKNNASDSAMSIDTLTILYSIRNGIRGAGATPNFKKLRYDLVDPTPGDLDTGMVFRLDTSISNNPMIKRIVEMAVHDWACATTVSWKIGADTTLQGLSADGVSLIYLDNSGGSPLGQFLGQTPTTCLDQITGDSILFYKELDIAMSRDLSALPGGKTWFYDTTRTLDLPANQHDFYGVILHELGHAHSLDHVNNPSDLMFSATTSGPILAINRLEIASQDMDGGIYVITKSTTINLSGCVDAAGMVQSIEECVSTDVRELFKSFGNITTYPNPFSYYGLNISYEITRNAFVHFRLFDYTGKEIITINEGYKPIGKYIEHIDTSTLSPGMYFLITNVNGQIQTNKVIKM